MSPFIIGVYLLAVGAIALLLMVRDYIRGAVELLSIRNFALVGFVLFQLVSPAVRLIPDRYDMFRMSDPAKAGATLAAMATVFLVIALISYRVAPGVRKPARALALRRPHIEDGFLVGIAVVLSALAIFMRFGVFIPYVAIVTNLVGVGFAAVSSGAIGWVWSKRLFHPAMILFAIPLLLVNAGAALSGDYSRRGLVAVGAGMLWGMYYGHWRYLRPKITLARLAIIGAVPVIVLALLTSARGHNTGKGAFDYINAMSQASVRDGILLLADGQVTGNATMWCIENYPETYEYDHLLTIRYFFLVPIPRAMWKDKPMPLSTRLGSFANVKGVAQDSIMLPAGIIGNAAAEGGWYALIIYALVAGVFLRFFDELIRQNPWSPFVVLPVGCQLGQVLGLARGEPSIFANTLVLSFIGVWLTMTLAARLLDALGVSRDVQAFAEPAEPEWCDYGDDAWRDAHASDDHAA